MIRNKDKRIDSAINNYILAPPVMTKLHWSWRLFFYYMHVKITIACIDYKAFSFLLLHMKYINKNIGYVYSYMQFVSNLTQSITAYWKKNMFLVCSKYEVQDSFLFIYALSIHLYDDSTLKARRKKIKRWFLTHRVDNVYW